jgi:uncharacterized protein (TIGR02270 family)
MIVSAVVSQHAEEVPILWNIRHTLVAGGRGAMGDLARLDDRIAAHLDGLTVAGVHAWRFCEAALEAPSAGAVFATAIRTIEERREERLDRLFALAEATPETRGGLISAFGWLRGDQLQGTIAPLLRSPHPFKRMIAIGACAAHRVDPGIALASCIQDVIPIVRARALRTAGELGRVELDSACAAATVYEDVECRFWAAWSSVLLGNRGGALDALARTGLDTNAHKTRAFGLTLQAMTTPAAHGLLQRLAQRPEELRWLIQGSGIVGDPAYVPWLIGHMGNNQMARLAGEAFSLITGADLGLQDLESKPPDTFESGPNDDPDDPNVEIDSDDGLPWPDPEHIQRWWIANASRFQTGERYFMGAPVTREHCIDVLKNGYQRQRILAAHYLCLLNPGTPLFNTSAPAWRQQRLLAEMK